MRASIRSSDISPSRSLTVLPHLDKGGPREQGRLTQDSPAGAAPTPRGPWGCPAAWNPRVLMAPVPFR